jgi:hypothetical protein
MTNASQPAFITVPPRCRGGRVAYGAGIFLACAVSSHRRPCERVRRRRSPFVADRRGHRTSQTTRLTGRQGEHFSSRRSAILRLRSPTSQNPVVHLRTPFVYLTTRRCTRAQYCDHHVATSTKPSTPRRRNFVNQMTSLPRATLIASWSDPALPHLGGAPKTPARPDGLGGIAAKPWPGSPFAPRDQDDGCKSARVIAPGSPLIANFWVPATVGVRCGA